SVCCRHCSPAYALALHSFPTRRSSDLEAAPGRRRARALRGTVDDGAFPRLAPRRGGKAPLGERCLCPRRRCGLARGCGGARARRSEEHTSELQSRENLVCRLLLEKKKN